MTPWIRVSSPMANWGQRLLYAGKMTRSAVAFEQNHPEKPYVLIPGMYHGEAKPSVF